MKLRNITNLQWALGVSVAVHAILLMVRLVDPEAFNRVFEDTALEVVLVNAAGKEAPDKAKVIAQTNMAGGGESEANVRATSPLPPSALSMVGDSAEDASRNKVEAMQEQQTLLLAQVKQILATMPPMDPRQAATQAERVEREDKRRQLIKLLAEIERRINQENSRPKKRFIGPAAREAVYAVYYDALRQAIEEKGTDNFPTSGGKKLYGELTMIVTVNHDGRVLDTEVVQGSGNPVLDKRAQAIARSAGPFGNFTKPMRQIADQLVVVSRFNFTRDQTLEAKVSGE